MNSGFSLSSLAGLVFAIAGGISLAGKLGIFSFEIPYIDWAIAVGSLIGGLYLLFKSLAGHRMIYV
jgi:hypothetical protein